MNTRIAIALACMFSASPAGALQVKTPGAAQPPGGYQAGSDDCAAPHTSLGSGDVFGVPFTTGTTGVTGQNETLCYAFGMTGIDGDVWFDWTATVDGTATLTSCGGTAVDTKVAIWPDQSPASCPPDGLALACNDDDCGLQSTVSWSAFVGDTYTIQLGTFPGASGGSGTFDVTEVETVKCLQQHDGSMEADLGLAAGGEIGWMQYVKCIPCFTWVRTAYGDVPNGRISRIVVYEDHDGTDRSPVSRTNELEILAITSAVVTNANTDVMNCILLTRVHRVGTTGKGTWIMATTQHLPGESPAPIDTSFDDEHAWVVGNSGPGALLTLAPLTSNSMPPTPLLTGAWMLDTLPEPELTCESPASIACFGDGGGAPCTCGNFSSPCGRSGCLNGLGVGAQLLASGTASVSSDNLVLSAAGVTTQPGLFFQGNNLILGGAGLSFGDGIRCCGMSVVRLQIVTPPGPQPATANSTVSIASVGSVSPGDTRCYQYWYRDPLGSPCGFNFNLSSAVVVVWLP